ncbi:hypothetical protein CL634_05295 [bacterium]|nr:hypothetical protein [bacterium]
MKALVKKIPTDPPAWYEGLELVDKTEPQVSPERPVKIKTVMGGICGTDVGIYLGKDSLAQAMAGNDGEDVTIGHEFCGQVVELHETARLEIARRLLRRKFSASTVVNYLKPKNEESLAQDPDLEKFLQDNFYVTAEMHFTCHECLQCRTGHEHVCKKTIGKGLHEDGAFTDYMVVPADRLLFFEKNEIPPEIISFMDALGNAVHTAQSVDLVGKTVLITGAGVQGLMSCAVARQMGANKIFMTDVKSDKEGAVDKLAVAKKLGADQTFDVGTEAGRKDLSNTIAQETDETGVDVVFEMAGHYNAYQTAFDSIRMGGTMLLLGLPAGKLEVDFTNEIVFKGLTIKGIYGRRVFDTWELMRRLLAEGLTEKLLDSGIITHQLSLDNFEEGFKALTEGRAIKVLLKPA